MEGEPSFTQFVDWVMMMTPFFWWHGKTYLFGIRTESFVTKEVVLVVASGSKMILNLLMSTAIAHLRHEGGQEEREGKE